MLLPLCFLYDVFWVFLQPLLLGGPSVMVQARRPALSTNVMCLHTATNQTCSVGSSASACCPALLSRHVTYIQFAWAN